MPIPHSNYCHRHIHGYGSRPTSWFQWWQYLPLTSTPCLTMETPPDLSPSVWRSNTCLAHCNRWGISIVHKLDRQTRQNIHTHPSHDRTNHCPNIREARVLPWPRPARSSPALNHWGIFLRHIEDFYAKKHRFRDPTPHRTRIAWSERHNSHARNICRPLPDSTI